jgi:hypothetical protein
MKTPKPSKKKPRSESKNPVVSIQLPRSIIEKIDAMAEGDERSRSWLMRKLLTDALNARLASKQLKSLPAAPDKLSKPA